MPDSPSARTPAATRTPPHRADARGWTIFPERGDDQVGLVLGERFTILERIGRGGMGSVFLCDDLALRSRAAVKVLRAADPDARRRFVEEATILANLRHPHLVQVLAVGEADDGAPFMAMEHLGQSLEARLQRAGQPIPWREVVEIAAQVVHALEALHRAGVIHRDVKPSNIAELRGATARPLVKLIDLGVARVEDWARVQAGGPSLPPRSPTRDGKVIGTPGFVPPESGLSRADARFDIYGLGVTIFKLITGEMPDPAAPRTMRAARPGLDVPDELEALVAAAMAVIPEERIASAEELARRLAAIRTVHAGEDEPLLFCGCYELLEILGVGAHAEVHRAYNRVTRRYVALKILRPEVRDDRKARLRLDREARALAVVDHPKIPALLDGRTDADQRRPFIAIAVAKGTRASEFCLRETRLAPREVVAVGLQIADALASMQDRGILHRDLNATNVLLDRSPNEGESPAAMLIDLGMVDFEDRFYAAVDERYPTPLEARTRIDDGGLENLEWTAPEARAGEGWTGRSDVYSLGLLLYRLLTGKRPTKDEGGAWVSPDGLVDGCPRPLGHAILAAIEDDPARRFDAVGLREALVEVAAEIDGEALIPESSSAQDEVAGEPPRARRTPRTDARAAASTTSRSRWFVAGFGVAMLIGFVWTLGREAGLREGTRTSGALVGAAAAIPKLVDPVEPDRSKSADHLDVEVIDPAAPSPSLPAPEIAEEKSSGDVTSTPTASLDEGRTTDSRSRRSRAAFRQRVDRLGDVEVQAGDLAKARDLFSRSLDLREELAKADPLSARRASTSSSPSSGSPKSPPRRMISQRSSSTCGPPTSAWTRWRRGARWRATRSARAFGTG